MILPKIALKNLTRQKRRSILIGGALAFGILVLTMSNGILNGFMRNLQNNWAQLSAAQIMITEVHKGEKGRLVFSFTNDDKLLAAVSGEGYSGQRVSRRTVMEIGGTLVWNGESVPRGLAGIDWSQDTGTAAGLEMVAGSAKDMAGSNGILIGLTAAEKLGLVPKKDPDVKTQKAWKKLPAAEQEAKKAAWEADRQAKIQQAIGAEILLTLPTISGQQNVGDFVLKGIYKGQFDLFAYTDKTVLNGLLTLPAEGYTRLGLMVDNYDLLNQRTKELYDRLKADYDVLPLDQVKGKPMDTIVSDLNKKEFTGSKIILTNVENEMGTMTMIFSIIKLVAFGFVMLLMVLIMVGITNTFRIVVFERTREIGTMRAVGMQRKQVRSVFLLEALFLALVGMLAGLVLGLLLLAGINLIQFNILAELSFFFDKGHLNPFIDPLLFLITIVLVLGLTLLAALLPASRAARLEPALALRTQF